MEIVCEFMQTSSWKQSSRAEVLKKKVDYLPDPGSLSLPGLKSQQEECKMGGLGFGFLSFSFLFPF